MSIFEQHSRWRENYLFFALSSFGMICCIFERENVSSFFQIFLLTKIVNFSLFKKFREFLFSLVSMTFS